MNGTPGQCENCYHKAQDGSIWCCPSCLPKERKLLNASIANAAAALKRLESKNTSQMEMAS